MSPLAKKTILLTVISASSLLEVCFFTAPKVELIEMCDPYRDMPAGMHGEVMFVDDAGGVHIAWANGSTLAAIHGIDRIRRID